MHYCDFEPKIRSHNSSDPPDRQSTHHQGQSLVPNFAAESEADRAADHVSRSWPLYLHNSSNRRDQKGIDSANGRTGGQAMAPSVQAGMEANFGRDFSQVRIHTGAAAEQKTHNMRAKAFAVGDDIYFGQGRYQPGTSTGIRLLGHELAHVAQQQPQQPVSRNAAIPIYLRTPVSVARQPLDEAEDDAAYRRDEAEDRNPRKPEPRRNPDPKPMTPGQASREAEREIQAMVDRSKSGEYRYTSTKHRQQETKRFRRLLSRYRANELKMLRAQLRTAPDASRKKELRRQIGEITVQRSAFQGQFDEPMRQPASATAQKTYRGTNRLHPDARVAKKPSQNARPDYTMAFSSRDGNVTVAQVNLKSHDLQDLSPGKARAIAREIVIQANENSRHLPSNDRLIISFIDQPPPAMQNEMRGIMFEKGSAVDEVRFGTATHYNTSRTPRVPLGDPGVGGQRTPGASTHQPQAPIPPGGTSAAHKTGTSTPVRPAPTLPSTTTTPQTSPKPSVRPAPNTSHNFYAGKTNTVYETNGVGGKVRVKVDGSDYPALPKPGQGQSSSRLGSAVTVAQTGLTLLDLYSETADDDTKATIGWVTHPMRSYFDSQIDSAYLQFQREFPSAQSELDYVEVQRLQSEYEDAWARQRYIPESQKAWLTIGLALEAIQKDNQLSHNPQLSNDTKFLQDMQNLQGRADQLRKPHVVRPADRHKAQEASHLFMEAMADAEKPMSKSLPELQVIAFDIRSRADLLLRVHDDLKKTYWDIISIVPLAYYWLGSLDSAIGLFGYLGERMAYFAAAASDRRNEYERKMAELEILKRRASNLQSTYKRGKDWRGLP